MRQVGDTLIWLGLTLVVSAVVYYTPRFATYVSASEADVTIRAAAPPLVNQGQSIASRHAFRNASDLPH